ncbi:MAG: YkgJ family cysteine cluster protein [Pseudomonadaceae bacterium]|nr:YkgJ family cysteine cluster protein [Pseudomonadaceae bacterium]
MNPTSEIEAGDFGHWLKVTLAAEAANVPCGECNACCRASYFIHITDNEYKTREHVPRELIFPAPGSGGKQWVMGFDETGSCPMLKQNSCSIYAHRPRTCRDFDCRVFAAAGISASQPGAGDAKAEVDQQVLRWRFSYKTGNDKRKHTAIKAAAAFIRENQQQLGAQAPATPTALALASLHIYELFLTEEGTDPVKPDLGTIKANLHPLNSSD